MHTKKAVIRSEFRRAIRVSSDEATSSRSCQKVKDLFESNGYRKQLVRRLRREVALTRRGQVRGKRRRLQHEEEDKSLDGYLTLPYIDEGVCAEVLSAVKKIGPQPASSMA